MTSHLQVILGFFGRQAYVRISNTGVRILTAVRIVLEVQGFIITQIG